jgi:hypothetical protein
MLILIPWKPVVVVWCLLAAMLWVGYVGYSVLEGKNPFAMEKHHSYRVQAHGTVDHETRDKSNPDLR